MMEDIASSYKLLKMNWNKVKSLQATMLQKYNAVTPQEHPLSDQSTESSRLFYDHLQDKRQDSRPPVFRVGSPNKTHKHQPQFCTAFTSSKPITA